MIRGAFARNIASLVLIVGGALSTWYALLISSSRPARLQPRPASLRQLDSESTDGCVLPNSLTRSGKRPTYVFLHLHKTAGNNLKIALFGFAKKNNLALYHTCRRSAGESLLYSWWFHRRKRANVDYDCDLVQFAGMSYDRRNSFDIVVGHQYFGVHNLMPQREVLYFTFFREPLARKISHFEHFETAGRDETGKATSSSELRKLVEYLQTRNRNYMVKRLSTTATPSELGAQLRSRIIDSSTSASTSALHQAQMNVAEMFFFVGLQERYSESLCVLSKILSKACFYQDGFGEVKGKGLKWARIAHEKTNARGLVQQVLEGLPRRERVSAASAEDLDYQLYNFASSVYERKLLNYPECRHISL